MYCVRPSSLLWRVLLRSAWTSWVKGEGTWLGKAPWLELASSIRGAKEQGNLYGQGLSEELFIRAHRDKKR